MFVIMAVATDTHAIGEAAAIAVGGTVGLNAMFGGPVSGASMNPARSIGPALVSGNLHALWLYIVAPIAGATLGAVAYQAVRQEAPASASLTFGSLPWGKPCFPHGPPSFRGRCLRGNLPVTPCPLPHAHRAEVAP